MNNYIYIYWGMVMIAVVIFFYIKLRFDWIFEKQKELLPQYLNTDNSDFEIFQKVLHLDKYAMRKWWCWDINKLIGTKAL